MRFWMVNVIYLLAAGCGNNFSFMGLTKGILCAIIGAGNRKSARLMGFLSFYVFVTSTKRHRCKSVSFYFWGLTRRINSVIIWKKQAGEAKQSQE